MVFRKNQNDLSQLSNFNSKLAEDEQVFLEILDIKRENIENENPFETSKSLSIDMSPELKEKPKEIIPPKNYLSYKTIHEKRSSLKNNSEKKAQSKILQNEENPPLIEEDEKVNFKSFQILKVIGSGAFGKIFLVNYL